VVFEARTGMGTVWARMLAFCDIAYMAFSQLLPARWGWLSRVSVSCTFTHSSDETYAQRHLQQYQQSERAYPHMHNWRSSAKIADEQAFERLACCQSSCMI
jgi:hypothetical protein